MSRGDMLFSELVVITDRSLGDFFFIKSTFLDHSLGGGLHCCLVIHVLLFIIPLIMLENLYSLYVLQN